MAEEILEALRPGQVTLQGARPANEDALWVDDEKGVFLVADGIGGPGKGDLASRLLTESMAKSLQEATSIENAIAEGLSLANRKIIATFLMDPALKGLGTTVTLGWLSEGRLKIWHVGDSRAYLIRNQKITCLTEDHTLERHLAKIGQASPSGPHTLLRCLGKDANCAIDTHEVALEPGDRVLLCTDGVYRSWTDEELVQAVEGSDLQEIALTLARGAIDRGSTDNASALLIGWEGGSLSPVQEPVIARTSALDREIDDIAREVLEIALKVTRADRGFVLLLEEGDWVPYGKDGRSNEVPEAAGRFIQWLATTQESVWTSNDALGLSLKDTGEVRGGLYLEGAKTDEPFLNLFAELASARLLSLKRLEESKRQLTVIQSLGTALFEAEGLEAMLKVLLKHCLDLTHASEGGVFIGASLQCLAAYDKEGREVTTLAVDKDLATRVIRHGKAELLVGGGASDTSTIVGFDLTTSICAPLRSSNQSLGVVFLHANAVIAELTEGDLELVTELLAYAVPAIEGARRLQALQNSHSNLSQALEGFKQTALPNAAGSLPRQGEIGEMRLEKLLTDLAAAKSSGKLTLTGPAGEGTVTFLEGRMVGCRSPYGNLEGPNALGELLSWEEATFRFEEGMESGEPFSDQALALGIEKAPRWRRVKRLVSLNAIPARLTDGGLDDYPFEQWLLIEKIDGETPVFRLAQSLMIDLLSVLEHVAELQSTCQIYLLKG